MNYNGVCKQYLSQVHFNNATTFMHDEISETDVVNFMNTLKQNQLLFSKQCDLTETVLPFLCQYVYPPCNGSGAQLISRSQCENIRDVVCNTEWKLAASLSTVLPVCEDFEESDNDLVNQSNNSQDALQPLQCHYQFKEFCGLCLPLCGKFSQYKAKTKLQEKSVLIFSGALGFIGGILVFIVAVIRRNKL